MQGAPKRRVSKCHLKDEGDGWLVVGQRVDRKTRLREVAWAHDDGRGDRAEQLHRAWTAAEGQDRRVAQRALQAEFPPSRWVSVPAGSPITPARLCDGGSGVSTAGDSGLASRPTRSDGILIEGDGAPLVMTFPATLRAVIEATEGNNGGPGRSSWERTSEHEVTIEVERDVEHDGVRAAVASVSVRRRTSVPVTAGVVRDIAVGDLTDWMLTRAPVVEALDGGDDYLGPGHGASAKARRALGRRTGKRGRVTVEQVAEVARTAPNRRLIATLRQAFPDVGDRTLKRLLKDARHQGLVEHTARSAKG